MNNPFSSLVSYLRSSRSELEKVSWPTRQDTVRYTIIVVASCTAFALLLGGLDLVFSKGVQVVVARGNASLGTGAAETPVVPQTEPIVTPAGVEAVDANGNPAPIQVTPTPIN